MGQGHCSDFENPVYNVDGPRRIKGPPFEMDFDVNRWSGGADLHILPCISVEEAQNSQLSSLVRDDRLFTAFPITYLQEH